MLYATENKPKTIDDKLTEMIDFSQFHEYTTGDDAKTTKQEMPHEVHCPHET